MAATLRDSTVVVAVVVVVVCTRPRAIPLAMITMRKSIHGFPLVSYMGMGLPDFESLFPHFMLSWSHLQLGFRVAFHMVIHIRSCEIPGENAEPVSQRFYMIYVK